MRISRRALAQLAVAATAAAQQPGSDELDAAKKQVERNSQALVQYEISQVAEPAFLFKA
jgi:hypothetical protein